MGLLANIKLTEEQEKEFVQKLDAWKAEEVKNLKVDLESKYKAKLEEAENVIQSLRKESESNVRKTRITENGDLDFTKEEAEIMDKKLTEWKEKLQEETEEQLGDKFMDVYKQGEEKMKQTYSDKFIKTLKNIYEEVEAAVKEKLLESAEFKAFAEMKKVVAPFIVEGEYKDTIVEDIGKYKEIIGEQKQKLEDIKIKAKLDQLTAKMPAAIKEEFINNIGEIKTEDELVEKFQKHVSLMKKVRDTLVEEIGSTDDSAEAGALKEEDEKAEGEEAAAEGEEAKAEDEEAAAEGEAKAEGEEAKAEGDEENAVEGQSNEEITEDIDSKKPAEEGKKEESTEDDIDYEILSEEFKRPEEKSEGLRRLQELAGLV